MSEQLLLNKMMEKNIIKYGDFTLKSGEKKQCIYKYKRVK